MSAIYAHSYFIPCSCLFMKCDNKIEKSCDVVFQTTNIPTGYQDGHITGCDFSPISSRLLSGIAISRPCIFKRFDIMHMEDMFYILCVQTPIGSRHCVYSCCIFNFLYPSDKGCGLLLISPLGIIARLTSDVLSWIFLSGVKLHYRWIFHRRLFAFQWVLLTSTSIILINWVRL